MNVNQIDGPSLQAANPPTKDEMAIRRAAAEFESLLLTQLTASLNPVENTDEEGLFSKSGGMGLAQQMFSEQFARTMSENGGIGIADLILKQVNGHRPSAPKANPFAAATRAIQETTTRPAAADPNPAKPANSKDPDFVSAPNSTRARRVHSNISEKITRVAATRVSLPDSPAPVRTSARVELSPPVTGPIRSVFGPRIDPINGKHRFHKGVDIAAASGTPIGAAAAGKVVFAGRNKGYGNMVLVEHADGRRTLYAHASRLFVKAGDVVSAGDTIAAVGSTGHSTGPHLHFEIRENNQAINPLPFLTNVLASNRR